MIWCQRTIFGEDGISQKKRLPTIKIPYEWGWFYSFSTHLCYERSQTISYLNSIVVLYCKLPFPLMCMQIQISYRLFWKKTFAMIVHLISWITTFYWRSNSKDLDLNTTVFRSLDFTVKGSWPFQTLVSRLFLCSYSYVWHCEEGQESMSWSQRKKERGLICWVQYAENVDWIWLLKVDLRYSM